MAHGTVLRVASYVTAGSAASGRSAGSIRTSAAFGPCHARSRGRWAPLAVGGGLRVLDAVDARQGDEHVQTVAGQAATGTTGGYDAGSLRLISRLNRSPTPFYPALQQVADAEPELGPLVRAGHHVDPVPETTRPGS